MWLYFLKYANELEIIPENFNEQIIKSAFNTLERYCWDKQNLIAYEDARLAYVDGINIIKENNI